MPYLDQKNISAIFEGNGPTTPGQLNYFLTVVVLLYLEHHGTSYRILNDITGALENAKLQFNRRVIAPYEEQKIDENGDLY